MQPPRIDYDDPRPVLGVILHPADWKTGQRMARAVGKPSGFSLPVLAISPAVARGDSWVVYDREGMEEEMRQAGIAWLRVVKCKP